MKADDRRLVLALLAVAAAILISLAVSNSPECQPYKQTPSVQSHNHEQHPGSGVWVVITEPFCASRVLVYRHREIINALSTLAIAAFTFTLFLVTRMQTKLTKDTLDLARDDFAATHRPWISTELKVDENGIHFDETGTFYIHLNTICRNVGATPAKKVSVVVRPHVLEGNPDKMGDAARLKQVLKAQEELSADIRSGDCIFQQDVGRVVFPGQQFEESVDNGFFDKQWLKVLSKGSDTLPPFYIIGIVSYVFTFGDGAQHQTGFAYEIGKMVPGVAGPIQRITIGEELGPKAVALMDMNTGPTFFAD